VKPVDKKQEKKDKQRLSRKAIEDEQKAKDKKKKERSERHKARKLTPSKRRISKRRTRSSSSRSSSGSYSDGEFTSRVAVRCSVNIGFNTTPRMDCVISKMNSRHKHAYRTLPDSGATRSLIGTDVMQELNLKYDKYSDTKIRLFNASGEPMKVKGGTTFKIMSEGCETVAITCLVTSDMPGDLLIGWKELLRMEILPARFPKGLGAPQKPAGSEDLEDHYAVRMANVKNKNNKKKKAHNLKKLKA
jgi:hypothetical protein